MEVGADEMVGSGLGCRVGAVRPVGRLLMERGLRRSERAVNFIRRDMQKAECALRGSRQSAPMLERRLEKREGTVDIGLDERGGAEDGAVHVAFRREVDDGVGRVPGEERSEQRAVQDRAVDEDVVGIFLERCEVIDVACVGERVEVDDLMATSRRLRARSSSR